MKIPVVEIIGAPGVGKTTYAKRLIKDSDNFGSKFKLVTDKVALLKPRIQFVSHKLWMKSIRFSKLESLVQGALFTRITKSSSAETLEHACTVWPDFVSYCFAGDTKDTRPMYNKLIGFDWFLTTLKKRTLLEINSNDSVVALMDEPLSYRLSMFNQFSNSDSWIKGYYKLMPRPTGLIFMSCSLEAIQTRLVNRERVARRHVSLSQNQLMSDLNFAIKVSKMARDILKDRGVPVLEISAEDSLHINSSKGIQFLQQLFRENQI